MGWGIPGYPNKTKSVRWKIRRVSHTHQSNDKIKIFFFFPDLHASGLLGIFLIFYFTLGRESIILDRMFSENVQRLHFKVSSLC